MMAVLFPPQFPEIIAMFKQVRKIALACNLPVFHHQDFVHMFDEIQPMGHNDQGFVFACFQQHAHDAAFRYVVKRRCRFVQNQHLFVLKDGSCKSQTLFLSPGQFDAPFTHVRVQMDRQ